jgi:hypothetical protein
MARISKGNELTQPVLQPGYTIQSDGFGLNTCTAKYKVNGSYVSSLDVSGVAFTVTGFTYMKAYRESVSFDSLGVATLTIDFVGIDPQVNGGARTRPNTSVANGLTSENITSHPNFFVAATGYNASIAGPAPYPESTKGPQITRSDGNKGNSYVSALKGACFERPNGGRFIGFVDPAFPNYYGKTNYLATTTTYSGIMYARDVSSVQALMALLNTATATNSWGIFNLIPSWAPVGASGGNNLNLLSQVNVEQFGGVYKILYEIRYSKTGWDKDTYINI